MCMDRYIMLSAKLISRMFLIIFLIILVAPFDPLYAIEKRVALVIGNANYRTDPLLNPINDANDMHNALIKCGFKVFKAIDADRARMRREIRRFGDNLLKYDVGLFYYAGHGIQVDGENYLVPVGASVHRGDEVIDECLRVSSVLRKMETAKNRINIIILDACRDNPFKKRYRAFNKGFAEMDAPAGTFIAYSTSPGTVSIDGNGRNGLYTSKLLKHLMTSGLKIEEVFKRVRLDVFNASMKEQLTWEHSSLMGDFYFIRNRAIKVKPYPQKKQQTYRESKKSPLPTDRTTANDWNDKATALLENGQYSNIYRALNYLNIAINKNPNFAEAYQNRGNAYRQTKRFSSAIEDYSKAIYLSPRNATSYNSRGLSYYSLGYVDLACWDFKYACKIGDCRFIKWAERNYVCQINQTDNKGMGSKRQL